MIAVLLAAGRGSRMGALTANTPKPLLRLQGQPILEHILLGLAAADVREVVVVVGYLGDQIVDYFGDGSRLGMHLSYRRQERAEGTARAIQLARAAVGEQPFLVSWGDVVIAQDQYARLRRDFEIHPCDALLSLNRVDDPWRGGAVYVDAQQRVTRLIEKPPRGSSTTPWNNAGIFICSAAIWPFVDSLAPSERGEYELPQAITSMIDNGRHVRGLPLDGFWSDLGTPEDLEAAQHQYTAEPEARGSRLPAHEQQRGAALIDAYTERYGQRPQFVARAPGRVNLLGEHTDYNGLPVLPLAIDCSTLIAGAARDDTSVVVANLDAHFAACEFPLAATIDADPPGSWINYVKAAAQGLHDDGTVLRRGANLLIDGNVPAGAGLSSSSALVVASALALLRANDTAINKPHLAELLPRAERYVGTLSGGMDQAISLLGRADHALRIDFFPLRWRPVRLPAGYSILVAHSLVAAEKSGLAKQAYNQRVIECRIACRAVEASMGGTVALATLGDLVRLFPERPLPTFLAPVAALLPDAPLTLGAIAAALRSTEAALQETCGIPASMHSRLAIVRRLRHVLHEAQRVNEAELALERGDIGRFGTLMNDSHASCRDDYEISCAELDELVQLCRSAGAIGARLTGAGFGGCIVALVPDRAVDGVLAQLDQNFYAVRRASPRQSRFLFKARTGAATYDVAPPVD